MKCKCGCGREIRPGTTWVINHDKIFKKYKRWCRKCRKIFVTKLKFGSVCKKCGGKG